MMEVVATCRSVAARRSLAEDRFVADLLGDVLVVILGLMVLGVVILGVVILGINNEGAKHQEREEKRGRGAAHHSCLRFSNFSGSCQAAVRSTLHWPELTGPHTVSFKPSPSVREKYGCT